MDNNLVVLDPDHTLMQRFQRALNKVLVQRDEKITLETREAKYQLEVLQILLIFELKLKYFFFFFKKKVKREREESGVELYGLQQELAKHQMLLEKEHDKYNETNQTRKLLEKDLDQTRNDFRTFQLQVNEELRKVRDLQMERDNLKLRIFYMNTAKDDIRGDIAVIRRATEKADIDKAKFEVEKQRQVLIF